MQSNEENQTAWAATSAFHHSYALPSLRELDLLPQQKLVQVPKPPDMIWIDETSRPTTRHHRCKYSQPQLDALNEVLRQTYFPSKECRLALSKSLDLSPRTIQIWFQNKRQMYKAKHGVLPSQEPNQESTSTP
ncbi:hypothetical protein DSO57_1021797 [Entomophthora muscae]|uniref:Uncharacterized protein n=1 Tax=Entomophthora muscae TaxID=34485 RepID=A0ACC2T3G0_9FUNG|nr:hypothetical protein DSO57_1021797 [Entomophthora muscae]